MMETAGDEQSTTSDERGYRLTVKVLIIKDGQICLGNVRNNVGKIKIHTFPGGGVEEGQTMEEAAKVECLQEVGIRIKNILSLGLVAQLEHSLREERKKLYKGSVIHYYIADYDGIDMSRYGEDNDVLEYEWIYPYYALKNINNSPKTPHTESRLRAVQLANSIISRRVFN